MNKSGWISVNKELPEANKHVLLFLKDNKGHQAQVVGYLFFSVEKEFEKCNNEFSAYNGGHIPDFLKRGYVLAWQPLPEPYK